MIAARVGQIFAVVRYLPRLWHVLKTEGPAVLLGKLKRRLVTTPFRVGGRPELIPANRCPEGLAFPEHLNPAVTLIVPVFNHWGLTCRCLAALHRHDSQYPFTLVLVDDCSTDETAERPAAYAGIRWLRNPDNLGFVRSCNRGAEEALGAYLVFLNNDTQVQPGWLDALVETFAQYPDAGIVGSRLLYSDGRQQEAGGIVFRDGSAWNYGHLDDPDKPRYSYVRDVDYVSGASLAIRRDLFERLGGFHEDFAPAYYEDVDLAFRVRATGYRVLYQPHSRVVHFEGMSAGRDEMAPTGMKRFQAINREKLVQRWGDALRRRGGRHDDLDRQKERRPRRHAFVVDVYMLTPDKESGSLRMMNLLSLLQGLGFKVTFAAANLEAIEPYVADLQKRGVEVLYRPYVKSIDKYLKAHGPEMDLVMLSRADAAVRVMPSARRHCPRARIVFDTVDLHYLREARLGQLTGDAGIRATAAQRRSEELGLVRQAHTTLVVSEVERALLAQEVADADVRLLSNIHAIYGSRRAFGERRDLLFIGAFAHPPNTDAALWFCRDILPLVLAEEPGIRLSVIGANPPAQVRALASDRVIIHGYVPDVAPFFDGYRLSVAPLRFGAGVKGKVNQSLAYGLPVVATPQAAEGMYLADGVSVLIAEDPADFATAILRLYRDSAQWERLSAGGIRVMEQHFSFDAARRVLIDLVGEPGEAA